MSDTEQKTPNKTSASGASSFEGKKIAYLLIPCEDGGRVDTKIAVSYYYHISNMFLIYLQNVPIPAGRSVVSCKKLLWRLNQKHKDEIEKIKAGAAFGSGEADASEKKTPKTATSRKRKDKADAEGGDAEAGAEGTPTKKKAGCRKKQGDAEVKDEEMSVKEEVKEENVEDDMEV